MKSVYRATIGLIVARFDWDGWGVFLAALLFFGEGVAVSFAAQSLASGGYDGGRLAALLGAAVLMLYVPLAIWRGKLPFAVPTEYEKRRVYAKKTLGVNIPRSGDKTKTGFALPNTQVHLEDSSEKSVRAAVGRAYCLGDQNLQHFCSAQWTEDVNLEIRRAVMELSPPTGFHFGFSAPGELLLPSQDQEVADD